MYPMGLQDNQGPSARANDVVYGVVHWHAAMISLRIAQGEILLPLGHYATRQSVSSGIRSAIGTQISWP